jgi:hypothetical protein
MTDNILQAQGFEFETGGGGCQLLTRYIDGGGFAWSTCLDGGGLPDESNWLVCAYGDDIDDILFDARSDDDSGLSLEQAAAQALLIASEFRSEFELCRNGKPIADCTCC